MVIETEADQILFSYKKVTSSTIIPSKKNQVS